MIKMAAADGSKGMIPDFLVASKSSLGYFWHIVEIKRFQDQFSNKRGDGLSPVGNKALTQCNKYLGHVSDYIDAVRSNIKVVDFVAPVRCVLLMGNSLNETDAQRICRANYDRQNPSIDVVSYHRLIGGLQLDTKPIIRS